MIKILRKSDLKHFCKIQEAVLFNILLLTLTPNKRSVAYTYTRTLARRTQIGYIKIQPAQNKTKSLNKSLRKK